MSHPRYTKEEIAERGQKLYDERIRASVEDTHQGEYLAVDIDTGDYEIDRSSVEALDRAAARHPNGALFLIRVGFPTAVKLGGRFTVQNS